jgi:hypothetical protein
MPGALTVHAALIVFAIAFWIKKAGSLSAWRSQRVEAAYSVHPSVVTAMGLIFGLGGVAIMLLGTPATGSDAMDRAAILYFGTLFLLVGAGISIIAGADWIGSKAKQPHKSDPGDG